MSKEHKSRKNESAFPDLSDEVKHAINVLNAPVDRSDLTADRQRRLDAAAVLKSSDDSYIAILKELGYFDERVHTSFSSGSDIIREYRGSTNPIAVTSYGTGLRSQTKPPRDLRDES